MDAGPGGILDDPRVGDQPDIFRGDAVPFGPDRASRFVASADSGHVDAASVPVADQLPHRAVPRPVDARSGTAGTGRAGGVVGRELCADADGLAGRHPGLYGGGGMSYLRLFVAFFRVGLVSETAYRVNFFIQVFQSVVALGMSLGGLSIIFSYTDLLGGWRPDEVLALLG